MKAAVTKSLGSGVTHWCRTRMTASTAAWLVMIAGCDTSDLPRRIVHGTVTVGGNRVETGEVRFVPIEGTRGPISAARIANGEFRVAERGGVPLGKHRVEIAAFRKTGKKVPGPREEPIDEQKPVASLKFASEESPLVAEVTAESDAPIDFELSSR